MQFCDITIKVPTPPRTHRFHCVEYSKLTFVYINSEQKSAIKIDVLRLQALLDKCVLSVQQASFNS